MITIAEKNRKNRRLLVIKNKNKTAIMEITKEMSVIDFGNKYNWVINNTNIDTT